MRSNIQGRDGLEALEEAPTTFMARHFPLKGFRRGLRADPRTAHDVGRMSGRAPGWPALVACLLVAGAAAPALAQGLDRERRGVALARDVDPAAQEARHALVIGNSAYDSVPLRNPRNDAEDMAATLKSVGFDVQLERDIDQERMEEAIRQFGQRLAAGGIGLFYYAGHGVQVDGENYLVPIGAKIVEKKDIRYKAVQLGQVLDEFAEAKNRLNILIIDACRDNPFRGFRGGTRGLAETKAPRGTLVAYATSPGSVAADGSGRNGVYTSNLLKRMKEPGLTIEQVFKQVRIGVVDDTGGAQTPWESSSLTGDFYFVGPPAVSAPQAIDVAMRPPAGTAPGAGTVDFQQLWDRRLAEMHKKHDETESFESRNLPSAMKADAWELFLQAYSDDNPFSRDDDKMRQHATERVQYWRSVVDPAAPSLPQQPNENKEEAARQALQRYKLAYESRDIEKLAAVWAMNPDQYEAMKKLFQCADYVKIDVDAGRVRVAANTVSIDFKQKIDFDGATCVRPPGVKAVAMTATMMPASDNRWMISSILPTRD